MTRTEKEKFVSDFTKIVNESQGIAFMAFEKLKVEDMTAFRLGLRKKDVRVKVVKNKLAKRVLKDGPYQAILEQLVGPVLVAYGAKDSVTTAKAIWEWADKEEFNAKVKIGVADGKVVSTAQIKALSMLPGREQLLVSFLWALKNHPTRFLYAVQDVPRKLGYALNALKEKKEKQS